MTLRDLELRAWDIQERIVQRNAKPSDPDITADLWGDMLKDVAAGFSAGPFRSRREVSAFVGTRDWVPTERFGIRQRDKTRGIDNAAGGAGSELNCATVPTEKL